MRVLAPIALALVLAGGCANGAGPGSDAKATGKLAKHGTAAATAGGGVAVGADGRTEAGARTKDGSSLRGGATAGGGSNAAGTAGRAQGPGRCFKPVSTERNTMPIEIRVEPQTVGVGEALRVVVKTKPGSLVAISLEFIDHQPHNAFAPPGRAAPDGTWVFAWTLTPDVPAGPARAIVAAGLDANNGATDAAGFTVRGKWEPTCTV